jgi:hypothetical protein
MIARPHPSRDVTRHEEDQMSSQLWFTSASFAVEDGEDGATNPGRYGRALARWVSEQLKRRGVPVEEVLPEDFGWVVMVARKPFPLWVACGNEDGSTSRWSMFVAAEPSPWQKLFRSVDPRPAVAELEAHLADIVGHVPDARDVVWEP